MTRWLDRHRHGDRGSALILVLVLVVVASLMLVPIMSYTTTVLRSNRVVAERTIRSEAVKAGLRAALADALELWHECDDSAVSARALAYVDAVTDAHTTCRYLGGEQLLAGAPADWGQAEIWNGDHVPAGYSGTAPHPCPTPPPTPTYSCDAEWWWSSHSADRDPERIWLPDLPAGGLAARSGGVEHSDCTIFYPGEYGDLTLDAANSPAYFASGVYYFTGVVRIEAGADVVAGMGPTEGCADDVDASTAAGAPAPTDITGAGATFVLGGQTGRIVVCDHDPLPADPDVCTTGSLSFVMNPRYADRAGHAAQAAAGAGVSIMTANGRVTGAGDFGIPGRLAVPGSADTTYTASGVNPHPVEPYPPTILAATGIYNTVADAPGVLVTWQAPPTPTNSAITGYSLTAPDGAEPETIAACPTLDRVWVDGAARHDVGVLSCWYPAAAGTYGSELREQIRLRAYNSVTEPAANACTWQGYACSAAATPDADFTVPSGAGPSNSGRPAAPPNARLETTDQLAGVGVPAVVTALLGAADVYVTPYSDALAVEWDVVSPASNGGAPITGYTATAPLTITIDELTAGIRADGLITAGLATSLANAVRSLLNAQAIAECGRLGVVCAVLGGVGGLLNGLVDDVLDTVEATVGQGFGTLGQAIAHLIGDQLQPALQGILAAALPNSGGQLDLGGAASCSTVEDMVSTAPTRACTIDTSAARDVLDDLLGISLDALVGGLLDGIEPVLGITGVPAPALDVTGALDGIRNGLLANLLQVSLLVEVTAHNALGESATAATALAGLNLWGTSYPWPAAVTPPAYVPTPVVAVLAGSPDTVVDVPGYVSVPQGVLRTFVTGGADVTIDGGVLSAFFDEHGSACTSHCPVEFDNTEVQRTLEIVTWLCADPAAACARAEAAGPVSTARVQVNRNGAWAINTWVIQPDRNASGP